MTERSRASLYQEPKRLRIGPSALSWDGTALCFQISEITAPLPSRIVGQVRVIPRALVEHSAILDAGGRHRWRPIAPSARVEVQLGSPDLRWSGDGYCDSNSGDEALETNIRHWNWSRGEVRDGTAVIYDVLERGGEQTSLALRFDRKGSLEAFTPPATVTLPSTAWRIARASRSDNGIATVERTLEDTPFYARSIIGSRLLGQATRSVHESLNLDRFRSPIVQAMLPFRMPRTR